MNQLEQNIQESFRLVKNDIMQLQNNLAVLNQNQERLMEWIQDTREKETALYQRVKDLHVKAEKLSSPNNVKTLNSPKKKARKTFVASRKGDKVHLDSCPFAKNIKPKSRLTFHSKAKALNEGFKPCECLKKI